MTPAADSSSHHGHLCLLKSWCAGWEAAANRLELGILDDHPQQCDQHPSPATVAARSRKDNVLSYYRVFSRRNLAFTAKEPDPESLRSYLDDGGFPAFLRERQDLVLQELPRDGHASGSADGDRLEFWRSEPTNLFWNLRKPQTCKFFPFRIAIFLQLPLGGDQPVKANDSKSGN